MPYFAKRKEIISQEFFPILLANRKKNLNHFEEIALKMIVVKNITDAIENEIGYMWIDFEDDLFGHMFLDNFGNLRIIEDHDFKCVRVRDLIYGYSFITNNGNVCIVCYHIPEDCKDIDKIQYYEKECERVIFSLNY